jgi:2-polyprenyl-3-methyl-5-hydroxy-6-metoxy-1,4-benzoquinol methylase
MFPSQLLLFKKSEKRWFKFPIKSGPLMKSSAKLKRKFFGSQELTTSVPGEDLDRRIARALRYMASQATWDQDEINRSVEEDSVRELSRETAAKALDYVAAQGIDIRKGRMMDLGAGLGMISEEAAVRGANPVAVEPGSGFREIALARIRRAGGGTLVAAIGESLPFPDNSLDFINSMDLLEH